MDASDGFQPSHHSGMDGTLDKVLGDDHCKRRRRHPTDSRRYNLAPPPPHPPYSDPHLRPLAHPRPEPFVQPQPSIVFSPSHDTASTTTSLPPTPDLRLVPLPPPDHYRLGGGGMNAPPLQPEGCWPPPLLEVHPYFGLPETVTQWFPRYDVPAPWITHPGLPFYGQQQQTGLFEAPASFCARPPSPSKVVAPPTLQLPIEPTPVFPNLHSSLLFDAVDPSPRIHEGPRLDLPFVPTQPPPSSSLRRRAEAHSTTTANSILPCPRADELIEGFDSWLHGVRPSFYLHLTFPSDR